MISHISKRMMGDDPQDVLTCYPNVADFYKKYCGDCTKRRDVPSIEIFSCMIQKLTKNRRRNDEF